MPIINGVKMACASCINGHRATRCNHGDRVMLQVRKPGRPLATCACIPERPCTCSAGVRVAYPRKKACKCGPDQEDVPSSGHSGVIKSEPFTPAITPTSTPISPTTARSFRVEKGIALPVMARKKSISATQFEHLDPATYNLRPAIQGAFPSAAQHMVMQAPAPRQIPLRIPFGMNPLENVDPQSYKPPQLIPSDYGNSNVHPVEPHFGLGQPIVTDLDSHMPGTSCGPPDHALSISRPEPSCCGPKGLQPVPQQQVQHLPPQPMPAARKRKCCDGGSENNETAMNGMQPVYPAAASDGWPHWPHTLAPTSFAAGVPADPFGPGQQAHGWALDGLPRGIPTPPFAPINGPIYYPANVGTMAQPVTPALYAQLQAQQLIPHQQLQSLSVDHQARDRGVDDDCNCGPGCSCLGCIQHPFNPRMMQYIQGVYEDHDQTSAGLGARNHSGSEPSGNGLLLTTETNPTSRIHGQSPESNSPEQTSPPDSYVGEELLQQLDGSDFVVFDVPCDGFTNTCPCGPDCGCAGCLFHNNQMLPPMPGFHF